jgi:xanthine dehydrogenase molybdenum-binding subunit
MTFMHIGKDFVPPDVEGKVTGDAKYAEDFRREGMVFARLLTSPMPSARIASIDASAALRMDGVIGILTADDLPPTLPPANPILASEYVTYVGQPILAIAATSEHIAENALDLIQVEFERRDFVVDPLDSLVEGGPDAYPEGNAMVLTAPEGDENTALVGVIKPVKWPAEEIEKLRRGEEPDGTFTAGWEYGDLDGEFAKCAVVVEESFVTAGTPHQCMEPRTSMVYWENGKCYFHASTQSQSAVNNGLAAMLGILPDDLVIINENTGGGFGSKGTSYPTMGISGNLSRLLNRPVQLRITREEEFYIGIGRPGMQGWIKTGLTAEGKVAAVDLIIISDGGPTGQNSASSSAGHISVLFQPSAMRLRNIPIFTNTTPRGAQRGPGQNEMAAVLAPIMDKAANQLGMDRVAFRRLNAANSDSGIYADQSPVTSAFMTQAIDKGVEMFGWQAKASQPRRRGNKLVGVGVGQGYHGAGGYGYDGLVRIHPSGKIDIHSGVGNLGTYSYAATSRTVAEVLQCSWDSCEIVHARTDKHLPHSSVQGGSNTIFTHSRSNYVAAMDALNKLKEIAAADFGGTVEEYSIGDERVFRTDDSRKGMSYGEAAQRAIELGGHYSGQEYPEDLNPITQRAVTALAGSGLIGAAKDNLERKGTPPGEIIGFMEIEIDADTGKIEVTDYLAVADCGTIMHPQGFSQQMNGGGVWGIGMAAYERHVYDPQNGLPANVGLYQSKLPSMLDVPANMASAAADIPDPFNPMGGRGIGEPSQGCAVAAMTSAIADALEGHLFNRIPVTADMIVNHVADNSYGPRSLKLNTF